MKVKLFTILFTLFLTLSYSQDFGEIKIDSKLQIKHSDTLKTIGERLTGKWKYLGKRKGEILIDTLNVSFTNNKKTTVIVENGTVFELSDGKRKKAEYYIETTYKFDNDKGYYALEEKSLNDDWKSINTCQPVPELIYYKEKFGILFTEMLGQNFEAIRDINTNTLILENGKEYKKTE
ncbi:hypothetical protein [Olleya namhaensis]|uniref:hypothetical protein n=1 Tax=Olleya namhaensis TaxID=1144750 RepID=UPI00249335BF|nr:hypothetical protein [Olleya namhaensis]